MRFAVISDVQANRHALDAVLAHMAAEGSRIHGIVSAGDLVGRGPQPNEVVETIRQREITSVRGNYDDAVAFDRIGSGADFPDLSAEEADAQAIAWTRRKLSPANLEYLQALPKDVRISPGVKGLQVARDSGDERTREYRRTYFIRALFGGLARPVVTAGKRVLVVHGSPRAMNEFVRAETAGSILAVIARDAHADLIISGHAGANFRRDCERVTFIGVGRVSGTPAEYAIVNVADEIEVEFFQVKYDSADHRRVLNESGLPSSLTSTASK